VLVVRSVVLVLERGGAVDVPLRRAESISDLKRPMNVFHIYTLLDKCIRSQPNVRLVPDLP